MVSMSSVRTTLTLDSDLAQDARELGVNVSAAARAGVEDAVRRAKLAQDRQSYIDQPEADDDWTDAQAWGSEEHATALLPSHLR